MDIEDLKNIAAKSVPSTRNTPESRIEEWKAVVVPKTVLHLGEVQILPEPDKIVIRANYRDDQGRRCTKYIAEIFFHADTFDEDLKRAQQFAASGQLLSACKTVKAFFDGLEESCADEDDPLIRAIGKDPTLSDLRRKVHAPLHAVLDPAIAAAQQPARHALLQFHEAPEEMDTMSWEAALPPRPERDNPQQADTNEASE